MAKLFQKLGIIIGNRPTWVLATAILIILPSIIGATRIGMETGLDTFVDKGSRAYQDYVSYEQAFSPTSSVIVLLTTDNTLDYDFLTAMNRLEDTLETEENIIRVTSLAGLIEDTTKRYYGRAYLPDSETYLRQISDQLPQDMLHGLMPDEQHAIVAVDIPLDLSNEGMERVLYQVENAVYWAEFPPDVDFTITGDPVFDMELQSGMSSSLTMMLVASSLLMVFILGQIFRHVRWRILPFAAVLVGVIWTFGATGFFSIPMTMVSMAIFPLLIGIGIDYAIQFHNRMDEEVKSGRSLRFATMESVRRVGPAVGIAVVIAILGYAALLTSPIPMIRDFGVLGIVGLLLCYLSAIFFLIPLLQKLYQWRGSKGRNKADNKISRQSEGRPSEPGTIARLLGAISLKAARYPLVVLMIAGLLCGLGYFYDQKLAITIEEEDMVPPTLPALVKMETWEHLIGETTSTMSLMIRADDVTDPEVLEWMDEFGQYEMEIQDEVRGASSLASLVKQANQGRIPDTSTEVSLILERIPEEYKDRYLEDGTLAVLNLDVVVDSAEEMNNLHDRIIADLGWKQPPVGTNTVITGFMVVLLPVIKALTTGRYTMTFLSLALIFVGLLIIYRDWTKALLPVIPVTLVTGFIGGIMYLLGLDYNPATTTLGALSFAVGAEYTVMIMARYYEEKSKGQTLFKALETAIKRVGVAVAASGVTSIAGFGALMLSDFPILHSFGLVTVMIFSLVLVVTFTVLPALIVLLDRWMYARGKGVASMSSMPELPE